MILIKSPTMFASAIQNVAAIHHKAWGMDRLLSNLREHEFDTEVLFLYMIGIF